MQKLAAVQPPVPLAQDSFARVASNGSTIKDIEDPSSKKKKMQSCQVDDKGQAYVFENFMNGYLFGKPVEVDEKNEYDEMSSPVLGRKRSSKADINSVVSSKHYSPTNKETSSLETSQGAKGGFALKVKQTADFGILMGCNDSNTDKESEGGYAGLAKRSFKGINNSEKKEIEKDN